MMILKMMRPDGVWRLIALAFGTAIVLRYVYWRTTSTLPPINQLENFIPGFLLYLAEMYSVCMLCAQPLRGGAAAAAAPAQRRSRPTGLPDGRRLHPDLQRGAGAARHHAGRGQGHGLSGRQADGLAARRRRHRPEAQLRQDRRGHRSAERRHADLQQALRRPRRQLPDARRGTSTPRPATSTTASRTRPASSSPCSTPTTRRRATS